MNPIHLILIAITLNSHTGEEIHRQRVPDTPVYESVDDCSVDQQAQGMGRVVNDQITVYVCQELVGEAQS